MNDMIKRSNPPTWMTTGQMVLITKYPKNYRPITCLPTVHKLLT